MGKIVIDIDNWKRKKKFEFFTSMIDPTFSITSAVEVSNCYKVAKQRDRSFFIYYSYAIIKAINEITEFRTRIIREDSVIEVCLFDEVDLVTPITINDDGEFTEVRIKYNTNFKEFYTSANEIISSASAEMDPITSEIPNTTFACVSALPYLDFLSVKLTVTEKGGINQVPLITVGKMTDKDGRKLMPIAISVHHGLVDGWHVSKFFERVQSILDSYN